jgi:hypothetical protein
LLVFISERSRDRVRATNSVDSVYKGTSLASNAYEYLISKNEAMLRANNAILDLAVKHSKHILTYKQIVDLIRMKTKINDLHLIYGERKW